MKIKNALFLGVIIASGISSPVFAQTAQESTDNHPMGYFAEKEAAAPHQSNNNNQTNTLQRTRSAAILGTTAASAPANLTSTDSSLPRKDVVDIASYQSWMKQADFNQLKAQGVKTVVIKLTESTDYTNPYAAQEITYAKNAGLNVALYHFAYFGDTTDQNTANSNAQKEATYFADQFNKIAKPLGLPTNTVVVEDAEYGDANSTWTPASLAFKSKLNALGFHNVRYYCSLNWTASAMKPENLGAKNMWIAEYLYGKPSNTDLRNTSYGAWQYTSQMYFTKFSQQKPLDVSIDYTNIFNAPLTTTSVYRVYNPNSGEHFYTENYTEVTQLKAAGWNLEGIGWQTVVSTNAAPVYRLYNPNTGGYHFYTLSSFEKDSLVKAGWRYEGISFRSYGKIAVYRAYNPNNGMHNYTTSSYEQSALIKAGWKNEGIAWYAE